MHGGVGRLKTLQLQQDDVDDKQAIRVTFSESDTPTTIFVDSVGKFAYVKKFNTFSFLLIADVSLSGFHRHVTLRSSVSVLNECTLPVDVLVALPGNRIRVAATLDPMAVHHVPCRLVPSLRLMVRPTPLPCKPSRPLSLRDPTQVLACGSEAEDGNDFSCLAYLQEENYLNIPEHKLVSSPHHAISLHVPLLFRNDLPCDLVLCRDKEEQRLRPGQEAAFYRSGVRLKFMVPSLNSSFSSVIAFQTGKTAKVLCLSSFSPSPCCSCCSGSANSTFLARRPTHSVHCVWATSTAPAAPSSSLSTRPSGSLISPKRRCTSVRSGSAFVAKFTEPTGQSNLASSQRPHPAAL